MLLQKRGDCFIRVSENNYTDTYISSSFTYNSFVCFDVLNGDMAVYLGNPYNNKLYSCCHAWFV